MRRFGLPLAGSALLMSGCALLFPLDGLTNGVDAGDASLVDAPIGSEASTPDGTTVDAMVEDGSTSDVSTDADARDAIPDVVALDAPDGSSLAYRNAVMADNPIFYLRLNESDGPTAHDETSHHLDGTYPPGGITYGAQGALVGDPSNTAVELTDDMANTGISMPADPRLDFTNNAPFTLEFWANASPSNANPAFILDHEDFDNRHGWLDYLEPDTVDAGDLQLETWNAGSDQAVTIAPLGLPTGAYHYAVITYDGTNEFIYIDAMAVAMQATPTDLDAVTIPWTIGKQNCQPCAGTFFIGSLDEIAVYGTALDQTRIMKHYQAALHGT